jgi:hypothetical protein
MVLYNRPVPHTSARKNKTREMEKSLENRRRKAAFDHPKGEDSACVGSENVLQAGE